MAHELAGPIWKMHQTCGTLTFDRRELPPGADLLEAMEDLGAELGPEPVATAGDDDLGSAPGGGPGSAAGERRCEVRDEDCIVIVDPYCFAAGLRRERERSVTGLLPSPKLGDQSSGRRLKEEIRGPGLRV
jgi:hypothetical protein